MSRRRTAWEKRWCARCGGRRARGRESQVGGAADVFGAADAEFRPDVHEIVVVDVGVGRPWRSAQVTSNMEIDRSRSTDLCKSWECPCRRAPHPYRTLTPHPMHPELLSSKYPTSLENGLRAAARPDHTQC